MTLFIALLRGISVGGKNMFKVAIRKLPGHLTKPDEAATVRNWKTLAHPGQLAAEMWV